MSALSAPILTTQPQHSRSLRPIFGSMAQCAHVAAARSGSRRSTEAA